MTYRIASVEALESRRLLDATLFQDLGPGETHGVPRELTNYNGHLYFVVAYRPTHPGGSGIFGFLWRTDGTQQGTEQVGPEPGKGLTPGTPTNLQHWVPNFQAYSGTWSVTPVGRRLYFYDIRHDGSSNMLRMSINSVDRSGTFSSTDLGRINLSAQQSVHDIRNVSGEVMFYLDRDMFHEDPVRRVSQWWTLKRTGDPFATGVTDPDAFVNFPGPQRATSATLNGVPFFADERDPAVGRELYYDPPPVTAPQGATPSALWKAFSNQPVRANVDLLSDDGSDDLLA
jgi:hypothetical protein